MTIRDLKLAIAAYDDDTEIVVGSVSTFQKQPVETLRQSIMVVVDNNVKPNKTTIVLQPLNTIML